MNCSIKVNAKRWKFYGKPDGSPFGAIALTEGTKTALPKNPQLEYKVDGKPVAEWKLVLVSTSKESIIGDVNYFVALKKVGQYSLDTNKNAILVKALSLIELESLIWKDKKDFRNSNGLMSLGHIDSDIEKIANIQGDFSAFER